VLDRDNDNNDGHKEDEQVANEDYEEEAEEDA